MKWVKASERMPVALKDRQRINIKYKGVADSIINISGRWYWNNDVPTEYLISQDSWLAIEWLDESTPPVSAMEDGCVDFVNDYIDAWEDGMAGDSSLYNKAKTLTTHTK